jgi:hypothetical protein
MGIDVRFYAFDKAHGLYVYQTLIISMKLDVGRHVSMIRIII